MSDYERGYWARDKMAEEELQELRAELEQVKAERDEFRHALDICARASDICGMASSGINSYAVEVLHKYKEDK